MTFLIFKIDNKDFPWKTANANISIVRRNTRQSVIRKLLAREKRSSAIENTNVTIETGRDDVAMHRGQPADFPVVLKFPHGTPLWLAYVKSISTK
jgi:hypothetical protein